MRSGRLCGRAPQQGGLAEEGCTFRLLQALAPLGLAYVHLEATADEAVLLGLRKTWPGTFMVNPSNPLALTAADKTAGEDWLSKGADLISYGRAYIANPDLVKRLRADLPRQAADPNTFYGGGH